MPATIRFRITFACLWMLMTMMAAIAILRVGTVDNPFLIGGIILNGAAMTGLFTVYLTRHIIMPLQKLTREMDEALTAQRTSVSTDKTNPEINDMADSFNRMLERVRALDELNKSDARRETSAESAVAEAWRMSPTDVLTAQPETLLDRQHAIRLLVARGRHLARALAGVYMESAGNETACRVATGFSESGRVEIARFAAAQWAEASCESGAHLVPSALGRDDLLPPAAAGGLAVLVVPLRWRDECLGLLGLVVPAAHPPEEAVWTALRTLAEAGATALRFAAAAHRVQEQYLESLRAVAQIWEEWRKCPEGYADAVARYAGMLAADLDMPVAMRMALTGAAYLHDIGSVGVNREVLAAKRWLAQAEREPLRQHPVVSAAMVKRMSLRHDINAIVLNHHEHWNGAGYPGSCRGAAIPLGARVLALAEAYHDIVLAQPLPPGHTREEHFAKLRESAGRQFDPELTERFIALLRRQP